MNAVGAGARDKPEMTERRINFGDFSLDRRHFMAGGAGLLLAGCAAAPEPRRSASQPSFYRNLAEHGARVDAEMAASMISGFRRNNGRGLLAVDPVLMRVAEVRAGELARANDINVRAAAVGARLAAAGYPARAAVESTSAGYLTLAEAFSGWRDSPPHRANMLNPGVTRLGIATAFVPGSRYRVFWALVLAEPTRVA